MRLRPARALYARILRFWHADVTPKTNDIFEDEFQVTINKKHLLSGSKVTTEDKTAEIVGTIISLAATATGRPLLMVMTEKPQPFFF
jgi:hypothetical protein